MNNFLADFEPVDVIAIIIVIFGLVIFYLNKDNSLLELVFLVAGFYFGRKHISRKKAGNL